MTTRARLPSNIGHSPAVLALGLALFEKTVVSVLGFDKIMQLSYSMDPHNGSTAPSHCTWFQEISAYPPPTMKVYWKFQRRGGLPRPNFVKESMRLN